MTLSDFDLKQGTLKYSFDVSRGYDYGISQLWFTEASTGKMFLLFEEIEKRPENKNRESVWGTIE